MAGAGVPGIHYRNNGLEDFSAELQGARIKRMLNMRESKMSKWTAVRIGALINREKSVAKKKLLDNLKWKQEEVRIIAEASGIPFEKMYVYNNNKRLPNKKTVLRPIRLSQVTVDPKLLNHFLGVQLDSRTRDSVVRHLVKLEKWVAKNKTKINHRRHKEKEKRRRIAILRFAYLKLHEETGVWPHELVRMKKIHGNYLHFQPRFDELKTKFKENPSFYSRGGNPLPEPK